MAETSRSRRRRARRRRAVAIAVGVLVLAGGGAVAIAATAGDGPSLQLASVRRGSVTQTVESSGTVTSSQKATPGFATPGTVQSVAVKVGDQVTKGQALARLDSTALQANVDSAEATLANARQRLEADRTGQLSASSNSSATGATSNNAASSARNSSNLTAASFSQAVLTAAKKPASPTTPSGNLAQLTAQVKQAQAALLTAQRAVDDGQAHIDAAQQTVDAAVARNATLRDAQTTACADATSGATVSTACASAMADYEASADTLTADLATLDAAISVQDGATKKLDGAITTLDRLVSQLAKAAASGSSGSGTGATHGSGATGNSGSANTGRSATGGSGSSGANNGNSNSAASQPATAAQLAADQAAIDAASAQVALAKQNLAAATLTSPIAGKVAEVGLSPGTGSSGKTIMVIGTGVQGVDATVSLAQVGTVKVGQPVTVAADGVSTRLHGTVASVGLLSTTSGSLTTFPVFVKLDPGSRHLFDGAGADVVIDIGTVADVVSVPNSAIHTGTAGRYTVSVVNGGKTTTTRVTLGLIGTDVSQVKSGLKIGDRVLLADPSKSLPSSSTSNTNRSFRFGGRGGGGVVVPNFGGGSVGGK